MAYDDSNIFARILRGEIPCKKVYEDAHVLAFEDINPAAPVHTLIIPKGRYVSVQDFSENASEAEIVGFTRAIHKVAELKGVKDAGYRVIANTGLNGGQEVPHYHIHIVGGAPLGAMVMRK
jgi:diadenosine tetraphosphate (Ap4A) HIT family hydrolase